MVNNMNAMDQIVSLIKAQDIVRQVYIQHDGTHAEQILKQLDKDMTKAINLLGHIFAKTLRGN
jgi:hypothetical protein